MASLTNRKLRYIFDTLGDFTRRKGWYNFRCPYHRGDSFKFGVNPDSRWYSCFVCGASGSTDSLYDDLKEGTVAVSGGIGILGGGTTREWQGGISPALLKRLNEEDSPEPRQDLSPGALLKHLNYLCDCPPSIARETARRYLHSRGIEDGDRVAGMLDEYPGRVVFPFVKDGQPVYFQARSFVDIPLKTLNPSEVDGWKPRGEVLWGYDNIRNQHERVVVLTEGIFDAIATWKATDICSTALLGKTISETQVMMLRSLGIQEVVVFLDADAMKEAVELALLLYRRHFYVRLVTWNIGVAAPDSDPANISVSTLRSLVIESRELDHLAEILLPLEYA